MKQSNNHVQPHKLKLHLIFHQVHLTLKFQCQIVLTLKNHQNKVISETSPRTLQNGKCQVSQQLEIDWQCQYIVARTQYLQSIMEISVLVHSSNGVIHAGLCNIDVTRSFNQSVLPLKKCSDKSATLTVTCTAQFLQNLGQEVSFNSSLFSPNNSYQGSIQKRLQRIKSTESIRASKVRESLLQISKIQMTSNRKMQNYLRLQNQQLQRENDELNQKIRSSERNQRETFQQLKDCLVKIQNLCLRLTEVEGLNDLNEMLLVEKDKSIKSYESEISKREERLRNYLEEINALERKVDSKEDALTRHTEKSNQKITKLQEQLHKITNLYATLLSKYQQSEKGSAMIMRQKEKAFQNQKSRLSKELKQYEQANEILKSDKIKVKKTLQDLKSEINADKTVQKYEQKLQNKQKIIKDLNYKLKSIKTQKQDIQLQLQKINNSKDDKLLLKKKITQLQSQNNLIKLQLQKYHQNMNQSESKHQITIKKYSKVQEERNHFQSQVQTLKTDLNLKEKQLKQIVKQTKNMKLVIQQLSEKIKLDEEQRDLLGSKLKGQIAFLVKQIQIVTAQKIQVQVKCKQLKVQIQKLNNIINDQKSKIAELNTEMVKVKQELLNEKKIKKDNNQTNITFRNRLAYLQLQQKKKQQIIQKLQKQLRQASLTVESQQKTIQNIGYQKQQLMEIKDSAIGAKCQLQKKLLQFEDIYLSQKQLNQQMKKSNSKKQLQIDIFSNERQIYTNKIQQLQQNLRNFTQQNSQYIKQINQLQLQLKLKNVQVNSNIYSSQNFNKVQVSLQTSFNSLKHQYQHFKNQTFSAAKSIFGLLENTQETSIDNIVYFSEQRLKQMQIQVLRKRNIQLQKKKTYEQALLQQKQFIENELVRLGQKFYERQKHFKSLIAQEKQDKFVLQQQYFEERGNFLGSMHELKYQIQQLTALKDKYYKENKLLQHRISQFQNDIVKLKETNLELSEKLEAEEQSKIQLSKKYRNIMTQSESNQSESESKRERMWQLQKQQQIASLKDIYQRRQQELNKKYQVLQRKLTQLQIQNKKTSFDLSVQLDLYSELQIKYKQVILANEQQFDSISRLQNDLQVKSKQISEKEIDISQHSSKSIQLEGKLTEVSEIKDTLERKIRDLRAQVRIREEEVSQWRIKMKETEEVNSEERRQSQSELSQLTEDVSIYKMMMEQARTIVQNLQKDKDRLEKQLQNTKLLTKTEANMEGFQKDINFDENYSSKLEGQLQVLNTNYDHAKSQICILQQEKIKLRKQLQQIYSQFQAKEREWRDIIANIYQKNNEEIDIVKQQYRLKIAKLEQERHQEQQLSVKIKQLTRKCQIQSAGISKLEHQLQKQKGVYELQIERLSTSLQQFYQKSQQQYLQHQQQRDQLIKQIQSLNYQFNLLKRQLTTLDRADDNSDRIVEELNIKINDLQAQLGQKQHYIIEWKERKSSRSLRMESLVSPRKQDLEQGKILEVMNSLQQLVAKSKQSLLNRDQYQQKVQQLLVQYQNLHQKLKFFVQSKK